MTTQEQNIKNVDDLIAGISSTIEGKSFEVQMQMLYRMSLTTYTNELTKMSGLDFLVRTASSEAGLVLEVIRLRELLEVKDAANN